MACMEDYDKPLHCHIQSSLQMKPRTEAKILITQTYCGKMWPKYEYISQAASQLQFAPSQPA